MPTVHFWLWRKPLASYCTNILVFQNTGPTGPGKLPTHLIHRKEGQICSDRNIYSEWKRKKTNLTYILKSMQIYNGHIVPYDELHICASLHRTPNAYVGILVLSMIDLEGGAFGRWLGHEGGVSRIRALIKEIPRSSPTLSIMQRYNENLGIQKRPCTQPQTVRNRLFFIWYPVSGILLRQPLQSKTWSLLIFLLFRNFKQD